MKRLFFGLAALGLILGLFAYAWSGRGGFWSAAGRYRFRFSAIRSGVGPPDSKTARYTPPRTALSRTGSASEPLSKILSEPDYRPDPTQPHPLLGQPATDFTLEDDQSNVVNLRRLRQQGPVVLIFYYGYSCNNCVAQLFGMDEDLALFRELGAQVIAVSADPPRDDGGTVQRVWPVRVPGALGPGPPGGTSVRGLPARFARPSRGQGSCHLPNRHGRARFLGQLRAEAVSEQRNAALRDRPKERTRSARLETAARPAAGRGSRGARPGAPRPVEGTRKGNRIKAAGARPPLSSTRTGPASPRRSVCAPAVMSLQCIADRRGGNAGGAARHSLREVRSCLLQMCGPD